jgi:hypothetical protein
MSAQAMGGETGVCWKQNEIFICVLSTSRTKFKYESHVYHKVISVERGLVYINR